MTKTPTIAWMHAEAEKAGKPLRTLEQVKANLADCKARENEQDIAMARLLLLAGRMTDDARAYVEGYGK